MPTNDIFDRRRCELGEGAFWHPQRQQFFWFDIVSNVLLSQEGGKPLTWAFEENVSAAGWLSADELLIAGETGLQSLHLVSGKREPVAAFPQNPILRSNDGRADPYGGFWIGTMGKRSEQEAGAIWRYWRGEFRMIYEGISIPNAICFDAERSLAYFSDTRLKKIWHVRLDTEGWPSDEPELFVDLTGAPHSPDGAVIDAQGNLWNAQWGGRRVACYAPDGQEIAAEYFEATRISCPAFGGTDMQSLFATSACQGMSAEAREAEPLAGMTFERKTTFRGVAEPRVILG